MYIIKKKKLTAVLNVQCCVINIYELI